MERPNGHAPADLRLSRRPDRAADSQPESVWDYLGDFAQARHRFMLGISDCYSFVAGWCECATGVRARSASFVDGMALTDRCVRADASPSDMLALIALVEAALPASSVRGVGGDIRLENGDFGICLSRANVATQTSLGALARGRSERGDGLCAILAGGRWWGIEISAIGILEPRPIPHTSLITAGDVSLAFRPDPSADGGARVAGQRIDSRFLTALPPGV